jgi:PII-like signaling protein
VMGFGAASRIHTAKLLELSTDLPIVVEIVDTEAKIGLLMPFVNETVRGGLVTIEKVKVVRYSHPA